jgi:hypothetical protein
VQPVLHFGRIAAGNYEHAVTFPDGELQGITILDVHAPRHCASGQYQDVAIGKHAINVENKCGDMSE